MVLIFTDSDDSSTNLVLDWLIARETPFLRINSEQNLTLVGCNLDHGLSISFTTDAGQTIHYTSDFDCVWYRRGMPRISMLWPNKLPKGSPVLHNIELLYNAEIDVLTRLFQYALSQIPSLGSPWALPENKIKDLETYQKCGGLIPRTIITGNKQELIAFMMSCAHPLIFKKLNYSFTLEVDGGVFMQYTEQLTPEIISSLPEDFGLTTFQVQTPKLFELRVFVLNESLYSMAIWSQGDIQTSVDFRRYNADQPNRFVPFSLPDEIRQQIHAFMRASGTNTGSIDMIYTPSGEYVFLEMNPIGQFGMVSQACNYNFEKHIADELERLRYDS